MELMNGYANQPVLVIGNSHTTAIARAVEETGNPDVFVVDLRDDDRSKGKLLYKEILDFSKFSRVFCTFGGSEHSVFGLMEAPAPFDFVEPHVPGVDDGRWLVPYFAVAEALRRALARQFKMLEQIREFTSVPITQIRTPPPFLAIDEQAMLPGVFREKLHLGIAPPALRRKLYELHSALVEEKCRALGIGMLGFPPETIDGQGFLLRKFWQRDPTHGNGAYGALVVKQISELANDR